jgi:hypothetical protein
MDANDSLAIETLYETDETAWLELTAEQVRARRFDMARRDRREVVSRLIVLLADLLKWRYQPEKRSGSWRATILEQQREMEMIVESGTLHDHAVATLDKAHGYARIEAAAETGLPLSAFPEDCPWDLGAILVDPGA